jgi:diguanylate cyclase (GGDEF)-like protein
MYPVLDKSGEVSRIAVFALDITERKRAEEQLLHDALYDGLTGLPNRALFIDRLGHALKRPNRKEHDPCAVIFLDLDRFKVVNDSLGHMAGDGLLKEAARRLERCIRPGDTVARLGGDEFVMLFEDVKEVEVAEAIAERIQEILSTPFLIEGTEIRCSASIGIALTSKDYEFPEEVLRDADITMYRAKALGRARYEVFDPAMRLEAAAVLQLENDLRHALERDEFRMQYQPIVRLVDERIVGVEALLRWEHPHRGMVCPDQFITLAEETGLIVPIGEWVLRKACSQMAAWRDRELGEMRVAINISAVQLRQSGFVDFVKKVVQETGTKTELLDLEITESVLMGRNDSIVQTFLGLRALGVKICLDDFGTGYSSLSYLQGLPIDVLKIDRSFTMNLDSVEENRKIIETILMLGKSLGAQVVAEGVETYEQLDYLRSVDCDYGQGFFFSRPVDEEALETIIGIQCGVDDTDGRRQAPINAFSVFPDRF